jgi:RNA binding exosome subunit
MFLNIQNSMVEKIFHNVNISVFVKDEEDYKLVEEFFLKLFPFNFKDAKVKLEKTEVQIVEERKMIILKVLLTRNRQVNDFMKNILQFFSKEDKDLIIEQIDTRIDKDSNFFFRIDKKSFIEEEKVVLTDDGNCFHFKCHVATYPQNLEKAKKLIISFFQNN